MICEEKLKFGILGITVADQLLFVVGGEDENQERPGAELIDLSGRGLQCQSPSDVPGPGTGLSSLKNELVHPLVCGGGIPPDYNVTHQCYQYQLEIDAWETGPETLNERFFSPTAGLSEGRYVVFGAGFSFATSDPFEYDYNTEVYHLSEFSLGPDIQPPLFPSLQRPCAVKISDDKTFFSYSHSSMIYDWSSDEWIYLPNSDIGIIPYIQCGYARKSNGTEMIVVVGAKMNYSMVWDLAENEWRYLETLHPPYWLGYNEKVQVRDTFLFPIYLNNTRNIIEFAPDQEKMDFEKRGDVAKVWPCCDPCG